MFLLIADFVSIIYLIYDIWICIHVSKHIKYMSADEVCKFLNNKTECSHPSMKKQFLKNNGFCSEKCSKRLGENVGISTIDSLKQNNIFFFIRMIIEVISVVILTILAI